MSQTLAINLDENDDYLNHIPTKANDKNKYVFYSLFEGNYYYPLHGCPLHQGQWLYHILTKSHKSNYNNITFINSDFLLEENYRKVKEKLGIVEDINIKSCPFFPMLNSYSNYIHLEYEMEDYHKTHCVDIEVNDEKKYNVVLLSSSERYYKYPLLDQLSKMKNVVFSNIRDNRIDDKNDWIKIDFSFDKDLMKISELDYGVLPCQYVNDNFYFQSDTFDSRQTIRLTDIDTFLGISNRFYPPKEYHQSIFELVPEAYTNHSCLFTDKMFKPLFFEKPFLVIAEKNRHNMLKKLGFELYDEIFDYDFDNLSFEERFYSIVEQIKMISEMNIKDAIELDHLVSEKKKHNKKLLLKYLKNEFKKTSEIFKINFKHETIQYAIILNYYKTLFNNM